MLCKNNDLGKYIHPKFSLKSGCGAAEEGSGGCVLSVKALTWHPQELSVCFRPAKDEGTWKGLKSHVQAIFTPLLRAVI